MQAHCMWDCSLAENSVVQLLDKKTAGSKLPAVGFLGLKA